jgi:hypothetical protein
MVIMAFTLLSPGDAGVCRQVVTQAAQAKTQIPALLGMTKGKEWDDRARGDNKEI